MNTIIKKVSVLFIVLSILGFHGFTQVYKKNSELHKTYPLQEEGKVVVTHKFGNIEITSWEKDSVKLDAQVVVKASSREKVEEISNSIKFKIYYDGKVVNIATQIEDNNNIIDEIIQFANDLLNGGNSDIRIGLQLKVPSSSKLILKNKFGDIILYSDFHQVSLSISHGDVKVSDLTGMNQLELKFAKLFGQYIDEGNLQCEYSDVYLDGCGSLRLDSRSSELEIDRAKNIRISSTRDKIKLGNVKICRGQSVMSKIHIMNLQKELDFQTRYGEMNVLSSSRDLINMILNTTYSDVSCSLHPEACLDFFLRKDRTDFYYPDGIKLEELIIDRESASAEYSGRLGTCSSSSGNVRINMNGGELKLFFNK